MTGFNHITAGRTALRASPVAAVLTTGIAGAVGTAAAEPIDGKGNDPFPPALYESLDGKGNDPYPLALYESRVVADAVEGKGDDGISSAFPIDNVTILNTYSVFTEQPSVFPLSLPEDFSVSDVVYMALAWSQDMDPYRSPHFRSPVSHGRIKRTHSFSATARPNSARGSAIPLIGFQ